MPPDFELEPENDEPNLGAYEVLNPGGGGGLGGWFKERLKLFAYMLFDDSGRVPIESFGCAIEWLCCAMPAWIAFGGLPRLPWT